MLFHSFQATHGTIDRQQPSVSFIQPQPPQASSDRRPSYPCVPCIRLKLSLLTTLSPKESLKYYAILKEPLRNSITASPKEPLNDVYDADYKEPFGSLRRRLKEPLKEQVNNNLKYRSKLKPKEEYRLESSWIKNLTIVCTPIVTYLSNTLNIYTISQSFISPVLNYALTSETSWTK